MFKVLDRVEAHTDSVWSVAWSRDEGEEVLLTGSVDTVVKSWHINGEGKLNGRHKLEGHRLGVVSVAVNSAGTVGMSSSLDSQIKIWDLERGNLIKDIDAGPVNAYSIAVAPNGQNVVAGSNTGDVTVFDVDRGDKVARLSSQGKFVMSVAYAPDGTRVAAGAIDGAVTVFDLTTGKQGSVQHQFGEAHSMPVRSVCFAPDERAQLLYTASDDGLIKLFDVRHPGHIGTMSGHGSWVLSVACRPDGTQIATGSSDKTVKVWDLRTRKCLHTSSTHTSQVWSVCYNRDGSRIASVSDANDLEVAEVP
mmetsp:Transcript_7542/g.19441  ORF Transcript_7542/g.19441 Transcript_7542/m.19441 type:complete len:306 (+) Transcript_7542:33-950(+)